MNDWHELQEDSDFWRVNYVCVHLNFFVNKNFQGP